MFNNACPYSEYIDEDNCYFCGSYYKICDEDCMMYPKSARYSDSSTDIQISSYTK